MKAKFKVSYSNLKFHPTENNLKLKAFHKISNLSYLSSPVTQPLGKRQKLVIQQLFESK